MGGRLVCEFAYIRRGETESDEVNRFPFGQTHVDFVKYAFRGIAATAERSSPGDCLRVANVKLKGRQYYNLTVLIPVDESPGIQGVYNHASRGCRKLLKQQNPAHITTGRGRNEKKHGESTTSTNNSSR